MERIIGIDPGSRTTGYGLVESDRGVLRFVTCGVIRTTVNMPFSYRLNQIFLGINEVIQLHSPTAAAVEDVFLATNPRSALKLGQARGAAVVAAMQNDLEVADYSAKQIKLAVAGYGQAGKEQVQHMVRTLLGLNRSPSSDAADALAVAICHANQFRI
ncbi:MAG: crossover junction endodeoxyribonuclease RuvC [Desulfocapsaceae bacterium]|jgi:crossover junction endodeoxyribonuclease RuvC